MYEVTMTEVEMTIAAVVGSIRQVAALKRGLTDRYGAEPGKGWQVHIEGAQGEQAVAKAFNVYWGGNVNTFKMGQDVHRWQVRTRSKHEYDLLVRDLDKIEDTFIHVTGLAPTYRIHGYMKGADCKLPKYRRTYGGRAAAFFVPAADIIPIENLTK
jgi:hypothetical protein